ncbi:MULTISPECIES: cupin domain-containing protein [Halomonas]|uniref:cupin domain-containing protein n=1 Tax=Halomonas TaxID=2745 RepID=UPI001C97D9D0|nr:MULTISPECIES: cupin domain-containing protein [Halomonas]MBY6208638.1 cupin domain-containing protein [Halomonas sp. DP3Y7-2]MBY6227109.1 cupin domain-containing protein [Halomonas sp. DP3Y7-1]MCA0915142.1 cupin domain-containing protein [Halomonas denitrificans]
MSSKHAIADKDLGDIRVIGPEDGRDYWQPVPANGHISVRIAPEDLKLETPFSLGTQTLPPQSYVREHYHPHHDEVLHFIKGHGIARVDGKEYEVVPGTTIFVGKNRRHMFINYDCDELHWLWFIQPNGLELFFRDIGREKRPGQPTPEPFARPENVLDIEKTTAFGPPLEDAYVPKF